MNLIATAPAWLLVLLGLLLAGAAIEDAWRLRIANLFSIGIIARPALPSRTASSASSNEKHGSGSASGAYSLSARCELAPGAP